MKLIFNLGQNKFFPLFLFLFAIIVQITFLAFLPPPEERNQCQDYKETYRPVAENFLQGKGFVKDDGNVCTLYPPGFPLVLAALFKIADKCSIKKLVAVSYFNVLSMALTSILVFFISRLALSEESAVISGIIWITYPFHLWLIKQPNSEIPFFIFYYSSILIFVYALKNNKNLLWFVMAGIIIASATYMRAITFYFPFVFIIIILMNKNCSIKKRFLQVIFLTLSFIITIMPWEIYVYKHTGMILPMTTSGSGGMIDGLTRYLKPGEAGDTIYVPDDVKLLMKSVDESSKNLTSIYKIFAYLFKYAMDNPEPVIKLFLMKVRRAWYATSTMWHEYKILVIQIFYIVSALIGIHLSFKKFKFNKLLLAFFLLTILYFWSITTLVLSILRYMIPAMGILIFFVGVFIVNLSEKYNLNNNKLRNKAL
jgi:4-amino-4-deoxy-L-arabinose transferase-like glycosyltransferase